MKRVAAEDHPTLIGYNETAFAKRLGYEHLSARDAAEIFRLNRLMTAEILRRLPDALSSEAGTQGTGRSHSRAVSGDLRRARRPPPQVHPREAQAARQAACDRAESIDLAHRRWSPQHVAVSPPAWPPTPLGRNFSSKKKPGSDRYRCPAGERPSVQ